MSKSNTVVGGVVVALVIAGKIAIKAGIFAALFGGATVANNAYQSRVDEVKREAAHFNETHTDEQITIDEANRVYTIHGRSSDINDEQADYLINNPEVKQKFGGEMASALASDKVDNIKFITDTKDKHSNYFLISQGWSEVITYETMTGKEWARITITNEDLN